MDSTPSMGELLLVLDQMGCGRWEWLFNERRLRFHGAFFEQFGVHDRPEHERTAWWDSLRHPDDARRIRRQLAQARDGMASTYSAEFRVRNQAGLWVWVLSQGCVVERDAHGQPLRVVGITQDASPLHAVQERLRGSQAKIAAIYQMLPMPAGILRLGDGRLLEVNAAFCTLSGMSRRESLGAGRACLRFWNAVDHRHALLERLRASGTLDQVPTCLHLRGRTVHGLISAQRILFDGEDCVVFVFQDTTEEQQRSRRLGAFNSLLQQAGRMAGLGAWEITVGHGITLWTNTCYAIHGLPVGSPIPDNYIDRHVAVRWRAPLREQFLTGLRTHEPWSMQLQIVRPDGRQVWVLVGCELVLENGRIRYLRGVMQDIDEAHRREEQLRESERHLSHMFRMVAMPMGISRRSDNKYLLVNPAWEALTGIHQEETEGLSALEMGLYEPHDRARMIAAIDAQGQLDNFEIKLCIRGGERRTVVQSIRELDYHGEPCWLFSAQDITERIESERRIREREELLSLTVSAAALGLWDWDLASGNITGDARWQSMHGLAPSRDARPWPASSRGITPQGRQSIQRALQAHVDNPAQPFDQTWRVVGGVPGAVRWIRNLGKIVNPGAQGRAVRMLGISLDVTQQLEQQEQLRHLAHHDGLTQLPNRLMLAEYLQEGMKQTRRDDSLLGVVYLDLDRFKPVNDRLGHDTGDRLLINVGKRLNGALRNNDCIARLGGDEFVILLRGLKSRADCERKLLQLMEVLSRPYALQPHEVSVTASMGYTLYPLDTADADADTLLRHADQAMYQAKQAGRNRFCGFDAQHARSQQEQQAQLLHLEQGLARDEFVLYLQPKVDVALGQVIGAECLIRWNHPERGVLAPADFLPSLAGSSLEITFDRWVLEETLRCVTRIQAAGWQLPLGANVSAQCLQQTGFSQKVLDSLGRYPSIDPALIELEITESAALSNMAHVSSELERLRKQGISVALDDFGTGYSSLTYLRRLPMDTLKIDQSFVRDMLSDPDDMTIVQSIIGLARAFDCAVIAEGVETPEQSQRLLQLGCPLQQGYFLAQPMPLPAFIEWVREWARRGSRESVAQT
ncbi:MAG: EAL domain-containing protein [Comamonas sp.]|nr:EAL domain-containing protein [Comamonas sp.]